MTSGIRVFVFTLLAGVFVSAQTGKTSGTLTVKLTDDRRVISQIMSEDLLLRILNTSPGQDHYGWEVRVVRRPYRLDSPNLVHHTPHGPDPMDVQAWHVAKRHFPNQRVIDVRGFPYRVTINLIEPVVEGTESEARFASGWVKVSWEKTP